MSALLLQRAAVLSVVADSLLEALIGTFHKLRANDAHASYTARLPEALPLHALHSQRLMSLLVMHSCSVLGMHQRLTGLPALPCCRSASAGRRLAQVMDLVERLGQRPPAGEHERISFWAVRGASCTSA